MAQEIRVKKIYSTEYNYFCVVYILSAWNKQTYKVNHIRFLDLFHSVYLSIRRIIMLLLSSMSCVWIQNPVIFGIILTNSEGSVYVLWSDSVGTLHFWCCVNYDKFMLQKVFSVWDRK